MPVERPHSPRRRFPRLRLPWSLCPFVALSLLLLPSCTQGPSFTVTDVRMTEQSDDGYVLTFTLLGENPNSDPLPLREVRYSLSLGGQRIFEGSRSAQATLPARGSQVITLPVAIENDAAGLGAPEPTEPPPAGAIADYRIAGSIEYLVPGSIAELLFDTQIRRPKADFAEAGTFEFTEGQ